MASRNEAFIKASLLVWARKSSGLDIAAAAKKASVKPEQIEAWETGDSRPSVPQLRKLAEVYKRPFAAFYLPEPPKDFDVLKDFRRLPNGEEPTASPQLLLEMRKARRRREIALNLLEESGEGINPFEFSVQISDNPDQPSPLIRNFLSISLETQFSWRDLYAPLSGWKSAIESQGVLVFQATGIDSEEARGFSIWHDVLPIIVLNSKDTPRGRTFTLLHEFAHIALRNTGVCDLHEVKSKNKDEALQLEVFCNRVAGATLVPKHSLLSEILVKSSHQSGQWGDQTIATLAAKYSVSHEVILKSLVLAGLASEEFYLKKRVEYQELYEQRKPSKGGPEVFRKAIAWNGFRYSQLVLNAYDEERITSRDLSDYLGVKLQHIEKMRLALDERMEA